MIVTQKPLTFVDGGRSVSVPAGTEVCVYNRSLDQDEDAEELLADARRRNAVAGSPAWLVMMVAGRARLLRRDEVGPQRASAPPPRPMVQAALF